MGEWIADASFIIHGAKVRARNEDEVDGVVYEIAESELFDDYVPLDAESTNASMTGARIVPGSENSRGVPLMTGDVRVSLYGMIVYADSEAEAEDEVRDALSDWAPAKFPFDGGREELVITGLQCYDDDDYDDGDEENWNLRSRTSGRGPAKPKAAIPRKRDAKGRFVSDSPKSKTKTVSGSVKASKKAKSAKGRGSCNTKSSSKAASQPRKANGQFSKKPKTSKPRSKGARR